MLPRALLRRPKSLLLYVKEKVSEIMGKEINQILRLWKSGLDLTKLGVN